MNASRVCPRCGDEYDELTAFCAKDGSRLVAAGQAGVDLVGTVIADRYRIDARLGEGGMGQVYLAEHVQMKRKSAIKIMRPALVGDSEALQRFTREAENASKISHPNVAAVYDFGETDDKVVYLAMEYIDGEPLSTKLERELAMHPDAAADILGQSADALQAAHDLGILHRDLKPDNIMLARRSDGTYMVKLVDFGIARTMDSGGDKLTRTGIAVGTPEYMSPEQLAGDTLDARSDQYSLALVAFVALTGKDAFPAETSKESLVARLTSRPQRLQDAKREVRWPNALQLIFDKALSPEAAERYESVREFAEALSSAISLMTPSQTAALYRRALEQRLASVAMRTPHTEINIARTPAEAQPTVAADAPEVTDEAAAQEDTAPSVDDTTRRPAPAQAKASPKPVSPAIAARRARTRRALSWALKSVMVMSGAFVIGMTVWAFWLDEPVSASAAGNTDASTPLAGDSTSTPATQVAHDASADPNGATVTTAAVADSVRRTLLDSIRRDSVSRVARARLDSIRRRSIAIATFPDSALAAGRVVAPNWRDRSTRGNDLRVVVMTPPVSAWRADAARQWKETHVRSADGGRYDKVDAIEQWSHWNALLSAQRAMVVIEVKPERAPFEQVDPEKVVDFKRGDVQSVQVLRDGTPVELDRGERFAAVVNDARYKEQQKAVPFAFAGAVAPDVFAPRADGTWPKIEVLVVDAMNRGRTARLQLSQGIVRRVHEDFEPYRAALR